MELILTKIPLAPPAITQWALRGHSTVIQVTGSLVPAMQLVILVALGHTLDLILQVVNVRKLTYCVNFSENIPM